MGPRCEQARFEKAIDIAERASHGCCEVLLEGVDVAWSTKSSLMMM